MPTARPRTACTTATLCTAVVLAIATAGCRPQPQVELVDLGALPAWSMVDQDGKPIGSQQLAGRPWVANFLFTSCPSSCPPLARATANLQKRLAVWMPAEGEPPVQLVSISVDPVTDTPEVLREFGRRYGADFRVWKLATGRYEDMERLVTDGFMLPIVRRDVAARSRRGADAGALDRPTPLDTAHSLRFVLVDAQGHLRGTFESDDNGLQRLDAALQLLDRMARVGD